MTQEMNCLNGGGGMKIDTLATNITTTGTYTLSGNVSDYTFIVFHSKNTENSGYERYHDSVILASSIPEKGSSAQQKLMCVDMQNYNNSGTRYGVSLWLCLDNNSLVINEMNVSNTGTLNGIDVIGIR